jgi:RecA/RadA recombinase
MPRRKTTDTAIQTPQERFQPDYFDLMDGIERKFKLATTVTSLEARKSSYLSTGLLGTDLMLGGGILPGAWYTFFGGEASAKSTHLFHILQGALLTNVPIILVFDFEGSADPVYIENMVNVTQNPSRQIPITDIFGSRDMEGNWVIKPRARLYSESVAEVFFDSMASLFRNLPDKEYLEGQWYYVYQNTKENRAKLPYFDKRLFSEFNRFYVPAESGQPQAIVFVDSYPTMFPDNLDEDDKGSGMAASARMFAQNIPKIASKLRRKSVTLIGVNQLRERPAVAFGNPLYEPGGQTLKFVSSCRVQQTSRAIPHATGQIEEEDSIYGSGKDTYRYVHMKAIKNKTSVPFLESWQRIWTRDANGIAHGFDPVWDVYHYLKSTGQISGSMKRLTLKLPGDQIVPQIKKGADDNLIKLTFKDLKGLVLLRGEALKAQCESLGLGRNPRVRDRCMDQLKSGNGMHLFFDNLSRKAKPDADD